MKGKFLVDTAWRFTKVRLVTSEKPQYINTSCRIAIDLRASKATALLQSTRFPKTPTPITTIADILTLKKQQRFDLMAVPIEVMQKRRTGGSLVVADVRLADGSVDAQATGTTHKTMPITLFFKGDARFDTFERCISRTPLLFFHLNGYLKNEAVEVATLKETSFWLEATCQKCEDMKKKLPFGDNTADVLKLPTVTPMDSIDYRTPRRH